MSRYGARSIPQALMGPSFGTAQDALQLAAGALSGDLKRSDVTKTVDLLPFKTLPVIRSVLEYYAKPYFNMKVEGGED